jgi:hypothetical protein
MEDGNTASMKIIKQYYSKQYIVTLCVNIFHIVRVGTPFVQELLAGIVAKFASEPELDLEIDPYYLKPLNQLDHIDKNKEALLEHARTILAQLCSKKMTDKIPPEIRAVSHILADICNTYCPDRKYCLVSTSLISR